MSSFLAFDLGASSGRAIIGNLKNGVLELEEVHRFPNGPVERDGAIYWDFDALCGELKTGLKKALQVQPRIDGIGIDTWGVDYVFFDRATGKKRRDPYHYRDARTENASQQLWKKLPKTRLYRATGIQCMTLNTIYQLYAHFDRHPEDFRDSFFLMMPDALAFQLGGDARSEYTDCSTTNLLDPETRQWDFELIEELGLPREVFPPIAPPCSRSGVLGAALQKELGCGAIPIFRIGSHDTASAVGAVPAPEQDSWAYISAGTWALLGAEIDRPLRSAAAEEAGFTNEGGLDGKIRFLTNVMGSWLFQECRRVWNERGADLGFARMEAMAREAQGCKYFINPNSQEFLTPGDMPGRIAEFIKRSGQGTPSDGEILRAIYDSLALYFSGKLTLLSRLLDSDYRTLNIVGGGTKDALLMQLTADALGYPVVAGPVEATAIGNLLGQSMAAGQIDGLTAARRVVRASFELKTYRPDAEMHRLYQTVKARFDALAK